MKYLIVLFHCSTELEFIFLKVARGDLTAVITKMDIFVTGFWILLVCCVVLYFYTKTALPSSKDANFNGFQRSYLTVYLLATGKIM